MGVRTSGITRCGKLGAAALLAALVLSACSQESSPKNDANPGAGTPAIAGGNGGLELPLQVGNLWVRSEACKKKLGGGNEDTLNRCLDDAKAQGVVDDEFAARVSEAYGGASARAGEYDSEGLDFRIDALAIGAETPRLWTRLDGKAREQRTGAHAFESVQTIDGVDCLVHTPGAVSISDELTPEDSSVEVCQKSAGGVTVQLNFFGLTDTAVLPVETAAALTNALYDGVQ